MTPPAPKKRSRRASESKLTFEDELSALEQVVRDLENGELGLTESLERYEQGVQHLASCYAQLDKAERRVELLRKVDPTGKVETEPFDADELTLDEKADSRGRRRTAKNRTEPAHESIPKVKRPPRDVRVSQEGASHVIPSGPENPDDENGAVDGSRGLF